MSGSDDTADKDNEQGMNGAACMCGTGAEVGGGGRAARVRFVVRLAYYIRHALLWRREPNRPFVSQLTALRCVCVRCTAVLSLPVF